MLTDALIVIARYGRQSLVVGLLGGLLLPGLAAVLRDWLPQIVAVLLFMTALRIGPHASIGGARDILRGLRLIAVYQLLLPLLAVALVAALGLASAPLAIVIILLLSAPAVSGAPNFTILLGYDPAPAMRLLILGTAFLPLTVLPVFWATPAFGDFTAAIAAALRLLVVIFAAIGLGFVARLILGRDLPDRRRLALDGLAAIGLVVIVIGLMSALGPALRTEPATVGLWLLAAFAVNYGLQIASRLALGRIPATVPLSIVAGNRNIALMLVSLPEEITDPLLIFIGCYQIPMYLTPILMRRFYAATAPA